MFNNEEILYDSEDVERLRNRMNEKRDLLMRQQNGEAVVDEVVEKARQINNNSTHSTQLTPSDPFDLLNLKEPNNIDTGLDEEIRQHLERGGGGEGEGDADSESESESNLGPDCQCDKLAEDLYELRIYQKLQSKMLNAYLEKMETKLRLRRRGVV